MRLSTEARIAPIAVSSRWSSELDVVGDDLRHRHPRLVHHDVSEAEPIGDAETLERQRPANGDRRALARRSPCSSPDAIISASSIAVVCSASISSSE